jgi:hypothetical protein
LFTHDDSKPEAQMLKRHGRIAAGLALVALLAAPGTAAASFNVLETETATTSTGATCTIQLLGGSDSRSSSLPPLLQNNYSNIDYGISYSCPANSYVNSSGGSVFMAPASQPDPLKDPSGYVSYEAGNVLPGRRGSPDPASNGAGCYEPEHSGYYDSCYATNTYNRGLPGYQYDISGEVWIGLPSNLSWTSTTGPGCGQPYPGDTVVYCYPHAQVTGY